MQRQSRGWVVYIGFLILIVVLVSVFSRNSSSVATVSASGKITGKAAGKCKVYAYAINGACKAVNVTVK